MKHLPCILLLISVIFLIGLADAGDEVSINSRLSSSKGGIVDLGGQTYTITDSIIVYSGTTLRNGKIVLQGHIGWAAWIPMISIIGQKNIVLDHLEIDANADNQDVNHGKGYHNMIHIIDCDNVTLSNSLLHDGKGDGFRAKTSTNVYCNGNTMYRLGHDGLFAIDSKNVIAHDNRITTRTNSALRDWNSEGVRFYDNVIDAQQDSQGGYPGIQIEYSKNVKPNLEICGNTIYMTWGPAIWLIAYDAGSQIKEGSWIHHNWFASTGISYNIANTGGISDYGTTGNLIENNVFDSCYNDGIEVKSSGSSSIRYNIICNTQRHVRSGADGYGINNENGASLSITDNCFYNNIAGNLNKCTSNNDDLQDPKTHQTSSGWTWTGGSWRCPAVKPTDLSMITPAKPGINPTVDQDNHDPLEMFKKFAESITDKAVDGGNDYKPNIKKETKGNIDAGIDIVGFRNMVEIDGKFYIKSLDDIITATEVNNLAMSPNTKSESVTYKNNGDGTVTANLHATIAYNTNKTSHVFRNGRIVSTSSSSMKTETANFYDTEKLPEMISKEDTIVNVSIMNNTVNPKTIFYVYPSIDTTKISFEYNGNTSWHFLKSGLIKHTPKNVEYVEMETIDGWRKAEGVGTAGGLYTIPKALTPEEVLKIRIESYSAFGGKSDLKVKKINIYEENLSNAINLKAYFLLVVLAILLSGTYLNLRMGLKWKF